MCSLPGGPHARLSAEKWKMLEELVIILKPFEEATRKLNVKRRVSSSKSDTLVACNLA